MSEILCLILAREKNGKLVFAWEELQRNGVGKVDEGMHASGSLRQAYSWLSVLISLPEADQNRRKTIVPSMVCF